MKNWNKKYHEGQSVYILPVIGKSYVKTVISLIYGNWLTTKSGHIVQHGSFIVDAKVYEDAVC